MGARDGAATQGVVPHMIYVVTMEVGEFEPLMSSLKILVVN